MLIRHKRKTQKDKNWGRVWESIDKGRLRWARSLFGYTIALAYWLRCDQAPEKPKEAPEHLWLIWASMRMIEAVPLWEAYTADPVQYFQQFETVKDICDFLLATINGILRHALDEYKKNEVPEKCLLHPYAVAIARTMFEESLEDSDENPFIRDTAKYTPDFHIFPNMKVPD